MLEGISDDGCGGTESEASTRPPNNISYNETAEVFAGLVMSTRTTAGPRGNPDRSFLRNMELI